MVFGEIAIAASPKILCHFLGTRYIRLKERVKQSNKQYRARSLYSLKNYLYQKFRRKPYSFFGERRISIRRQQPCANQIAQLIKQRLNLLRAMIFYI